MHVCIWSISFLNIYNYQIINQLTMNKYSSEMLMKPLLTQKSFADKKLDKSQYTTVQKPTLRKFTIESKQFPKLLKTKKKNDQNLIANPSMKQLNESHNVSKRIHLLPNNNKMSTDRQPRIKKLKLQRLISQSLKTFSEEKRRKMKEQKNLSSSRQKLTQNLKIMNKNIRYENHKKVITQPSADIPLQSRLPWGTNQSRIKKYVISTIQKIDKMSKSRKKKSEEKIHSSKNSPQARQQNRKKLGLGFLNGLNEQQIKKLVDKSKSNSKERCSSSSLSNSNSKSISKDRSFHREKQRILTNVCDKIPLILKKSPQQQFITIQKKTPVNKTNKN